jgi:hypothetical protein
VGSNPTRGVDVCVCVHVAALRHSPRRPADCLRDPCLQTNSDGNTKMEEHHEIRTANGRVSSRLPFSQLQGNDWQSGDHSFG